MSKPRDGWRPYVKNILRAYPMQKELLSEMKRASVTTKYNPGRSGSGVSRSTEQSALRGLPPNRQKEYDAIRKAWNRTRAMEDSGKLRCRIIELVYFHGTHNLTGAAHACYVSYQTAQRWHNDFLHLVARYLDIE